VRSARLVMKASSARWEMRVPRCPPTLNAVSSPRRMKSSSTVRRQRRAFAASVMDRTIGGVMSCMSTFIGQHRTKGNRNFSRLKYWGEVPTVAGVDLVRTSADVRGRMKKTTAAVRRDDKKVTVSMLPKTHARLNRAAPAHRVSNNRYVQMAIEFFLDCEEAFGGPPTPQFRDATVGQLRRTQEKLKQFLAEG